MKRHAVVYICFKSSLVKIKGQSIVVQGCGVDDDDDDADDDD